MLGERIAERRKKLGLSQEELAEKLNISQKSISKYELGDRKPQYKVLVRMAEYFGVTTDYLLELDGDGNDMFGKRIAELRKACDMSQKELGEKLGLSASAIGMYEQGRRDPSNAILIGMEKLFGVTVDYLLGAEESGETSITDCGSIIKELRKETGMTQEELGEKLGVIKQTVSSWEKGISEVNNDTLITLSRLFGVSTDYLLGLSGGEKHMKNRLKELREAEGMKQSELGELLNVQDAAISKYESGKVPMTEDKIIQIAEYFGVTTDYLLGLTEGEDTMGTEENTNEIMQRVGRNIRSIREQAGLSQRDFAEGFSVSNGAVGMWETGKRQPDLNILIKIAHFGGTNLDDLVMKELTPPVPLYVRNMVYLRKKRGYSQGELATVLGLQGAGSIDLVESGKCELPVSKLVRLADFFGVTMDQITKQDLSQEVSECRQQ